MENLTQGTTGKTGAATKVIKRYQNRKLYDTQQSCYVTLDDIAKMIRASEEVTIVDNKTKRDITASTLAQIIFEAEKKASEYAPLIVLREIIQHSNGSMSSYLAKLGVFKAEARKEEKVYVEPTKSFDDLKASLENRVATAAEKPLVEGLSSGNKSLNKDNVEATPELPGANRSFNN
jgi:polyhydroxyalkanoate synthesis repressor PhaR